MPPPSHFCQHLLPLLLYVAGQISTSTCSEEEFRRPEVSQHGGLRRTLDACPAAVGPATPAGGPARRCRGGAGSRRDAPGGHVEAGARRGRAGRGRPRSQHEPAPPAGAGSLTAGCRSGLSGERAHPLTPLLSQAVLPPARRPGHCVPAPARWHPAQPLAPASSPCLRSRLALGAQPPRRPAGERAGAARGPGGGRGRPRHPGGALQPWSAASCPESAQTCPSPHLSPGVEPGRVWGPE